jgi:ferredoxin
MFSTSAKKSSHIVHADASKCAGCMICMLRCSFRLDKKFNLAASRIQIKRLLGHAGEFEITFTDECDNCGICVRYCPYGALTAQKVRKEV